nr:MAG TPA: hypothetical protein [Caudoviricetes sp.]
MGQKRQNAGKCNIHNNRLKNLCSITKLMKFG